ncbi:MAG: Transporter [Labilithrix sp.]|nr:Transporter [Labilithrix sp.]
MVRALGEPHLRPRIVSTSRRGGHDDDVLRTHLESARRPDTRCGVAFARPEIENGREGNELFVAVAVEALADLEALPTHARTGEWLTFTSRLHVPATNAKLVVLGPRGLPRTVPTSIDRASGAVRARFALDRPGAFTVQLVGDLANGPQPLLEARIFADVALPAGEETPSPAPGEEAGADATDPAAALARMTAAARAAESLPPLKRNERLDALAYAHAEKMSEKQAVAHDLGDGDLAQRFEVAALAATSVAENVARARSIVLAHRALHASPSHRMNLLRPEHTHFGVGVVRDEAGNVHVCQVFAAGLR